jgi:hypothetical protein
MGNARRILCDFGAAEIALMKAEAFLEEGSGDAQEGARILDFKASLLRAQSRFDSALATIDKVISIYRKLHDAHRQGRALLSKAVIHGHAGEQEKGISLFSQALDLIDMNREPRLAFNAYNNLFVDLTEIGHYKEAIALLPEVHKHLAFSGSSRMDRITIQWSQAQLESELGQLDAAESKLRFVRNEFMAMGMGYDAALALLDLAKVYIRQDRASESRRLVTEMHEVFISGEIPREVLGVLAFFQEALEQDRATVKLVEAVTGYFKKAYGNPGHYFEKPA